MWGQLHVATHGKTPAPGKHHRTLHPKGLGERERKERIVEGKNNIYLKKSGCGRSGDLSDYREEFVVEVEKQRLRFRGLRVAEAALVELNVPAARARPLYGERTVCE